MQTGNVVGNCLNFPIVEFGSDLRHLLAVLAHAISECCQLGDGVIGVLATQARVLCRNASAIGAVAACAGRNLTIGDAATVNPLSQGQCLFVLGSARFRYLLTVTSKTLPTSSEKSLAGTGVDYLLQWPCNIGRMCIIIGFCWGGGGSVQERS